MSKQEILLQEKRERKFDDNFKTTFKKKILIATALQKWI